MSWKETLGAIAPTIATALGGPFAGAATKFLSNKFLDKENSTEQELEEFILSASPEKLVEVKASDNEFKLQMERLGVDVFRIEAGDKKNARKEHKLSNMPALLSVGLTVVIAVLLYALFYIEPPAGAREPLLIVLGMVVKEWSNSMHYWFGTTRSSSEKNKFI